MCIKRKPDLLNSRRQVCLLLNACKSVEQWSHCASFYADLCLTKCSIIFAIWQKTSTAANLATPKNLGLLFGALYLHTGQQTICLLLFVYSGGQLQIFNSNTTKTITWRWRSLCIVTRREGTVASLSEDSELGFRVYREALWKYSGTHALN